MKEMELGWDAQPRRATTAIQRLQHMLKIYRSQIFFMETKLNVDHMEKVWRRCGFQNGFEIPTDGTCGGLTLGWNGGQLVTLRSFSKNHIDIEI
ncbi:hypothetical protein J1N35_011121 [Gossypium stocksii]|uniref:Uncharacterized protein n=1 Tax=Gossypium stocksii TaxID=47602 RepID=A0A9D4ACW9_9ROSI|nr:hypothetical protein J1N35_011121 [Gossypium stocksii]